MTDPESRLPEAHAQRGHLAGAAGQAAAAVMEEAHAIACERSQWACNEKHVIALAGLDGMHALFAEIPDDRARLVQWVDRVAEELGGPSGEATPWRRGEVEGSTP